MPPEGTPGPGRAPRVVLGVGGGIAAYKVALLLRLLTESGHRVRVVPTAAALRFVGEPTWAALSGQPVATDVWTDVHLVPHVRLGREADLVVVAPASADLLARAAHGLADDLLTNTLLTARCPVLMVPAMHTEMWEHPATRANVATLRGRGVAVLDPASGRLTGADTGPGRMCEPEEIAAACRRALAGARGRDLAGRRVVISAGGTREPLDPVRFLGNSSSGRQGWALAAAAAARGAQVTLVAANIGLAPPGGVEVVPVGTALQLRQAVRAAAAQADVVVMAAAVADFRPTSAAGHKIKKDDGDGAPTLTLQRNPDVLAELSRQRLRAGQVVVGFAAETGEPGRSVLDLALAKLRRKGCDLLVVNEVGVGKGFGTLTNEVVLLRPDGGAREVPESSKDVVADAVWDDVVAILGDRGSVPQSSTPAFDP